MERKIKPKLKTLNKIINEALKEDIGKGDITTNSIVPKSLKAEAEFLVKENGIIAGLDIAINVFSRLDKEIYSEKYFNDGDFVRKGTIIAKVHGKARAILTGERLALNILQRLSGIASLTSKFVEKAGKIKILDTRKTTPCLRELERYAVRIGGGCNHRFNLNDAVLIKDNHIEIAGSVSEAIKRARKTGKKIEVEVTNLNELREALNANAERILLDNMPLSQIKKAVRIVKGKAETEISGGVNLKRIKKLSETGADFFSVGALTHSAKSLDISLEVKNEK